jgi:mannose-6-phosphate isomerase-like protein (cupin superfamily)
MGLADAPPQHSVTPKRKGQEMAKVKAKPKGTRKVNKRAPTARRAGKNARSARKVSARSRAAATKGRAKSKARPRRQTFVANHLNPDAFEDGLRSYAKYRDLDIVSATKGLARAHVIKMIPPIDPAEVSKRHYHDVEFQMIYVLKGWIKGEYEGAGVVTMREGSCWLQPPRIKHSVLDYSDDCELLEIIMPADFETVELE